LSIYTIIQTKDFQKKCINHIRKRFCPLFLVAESDKYDVIA